MHGGEAVLWEVFNLRNQFHLVEVPDRTDDVVLARAQQRFRGLPAEAGRRARDDHELLVSKLLFGLHLIEDV